MLPRLDNTQMMAVEAGIDNRRSYELVEMPTNVQRSDLPEWLLGLSIHWYIGYGNRPHITLKTWSWYDKDHPEWSIKHWDNQVYDYDDVHQFYFSESEDGRGDFYGAGPMFMQHVKYHDPETKEWKEGPRFRSSRTQGLGGALVPIKLRNGTEGELWGAWIGQQLPGYIDVASSSGAGWITDELFLKALAYYKPHLRAARVRRGSVNTVEPILDGFPPKDFKGAPWRYTDNPKGEKIESYYLKRMEGKPDLLEQDN